MASQRQSVAQTITYGVVALAVVSVVGGIIFMWQFSKVAKEIGDDAEGEASEHPPDQLTAIGAFDPLLQKTAAPEVPTMSVAQVAQEAGFDG